jgi:DHA2 family multidrug resistance protein
MGLLSAKLDPRWLIVTGLLVAAFAMFRMTGFNTQIDYNTIVYVRIIQALGLAFLFIPINTAAYVAIPTEKSNNASALINLARNLGGGIGISLIETHLARRTQYHQNVLVGHVNPYDAQYHHMVQGLARHFAQQGADAVHALHQAQAMVYAMLQKQASMLAFIDDFRMLALIFLALIPFVFFLKKAQPRKGPATAH